MSLSATAPTARAYWTVEGSSARSGSRWPTSSSTAFYATTGTRKFQEGTAEDEAMTTGLPPFHFSPFSDNIFRGTWSAAAGGERVGLRLFYDFCKVTCWNCGRDNQYINDLQRTRSTMFGRTMTEWVDDPSLECRQCGKALPNPTRIAGMADTDL